MSRYLTTLHHPAHGGNRCASDRPWHLLDAPIVEHFKALAGDRGYQTLINDTLRRVIREELAPPV